MRGQQTGGRVAYFPINVSQPEGSFFIHGDIPLPDLGRVVREEVRAIDKAVLVERFRALQEDVDAMVGKERMVGRLAGALAIIALSLAALGLYGILAYGVSQRVPEIGLRAALGAGPATLARMILGDALRLVAVGFALGSLGAVLSTRLLTSLLFGIEALDPLTMALAPTILAIVALSAAYLPARRAAYVDPATALRFE